MITHEELSTDIQLKSLCFLILFRAFVHSEIHLLQNPFLLYRVVQIFLVFKFFYFRLKETCNTFFMICTDRMPPGDLNSKILMHKLH